MDSTLQRNRPDLKQVTGALITDDKGFDCFTLERLDKLIPAGRYLCRYTVSPRLSQLALENWLAQHPDKNEGDAPEGVVNYRTYEVLGVPGRIGIRIHSFNTYLQSDGCITTCDGFKDINKDGEIDAIDARKMVHAFEEYQMHEDFYLIIINSD